MPSDCFILFQDGNAWCAAPPGFRNYSEDPSGWGDTPAQAVQDLLKVPEFQERARENGWPEPKLADFQRVSMPESTVIEAIELIDLKSNIEAAKRRQSFKVVSDG
jgi:hypothetical protein